MSGGTVILIGVVLVVMLSFYKAMIILNEHERAVVFRLGKFEQILGPGMNIIVPFTDKVKKVNLNERLPGWNTMAIDELNERIKNIVITEA